jgi:hypothetical protein
MLGREKLGALASFACAIVAVVFSMVAAPAHAVPSFARQTGLACEACHTVFPELTPFGRQFKANGYLIDNLPQVKGVTADNKDAVLLNWIPPLSVQFIASYSKVKKSVPDDAGGATQNGNAAFPDQASLVYAGRIAPKLGGFIQITYTQADGTFGWDNTDLRFADQTSLGGKNLTYGVTLNNNPTVQDLWNSTPAWGVPFAQRSGSTPSIVAQSLIDQQVGGNVVGITAYGYWNNLIYAEIGGYRSAPQGCSNPINTTCNAPIIRNLATYWRLAIEKQWDRHSLMGGFYGLMSDVYPQVASVVPGAPNVNYSSGPTDRYHDSALDAQYQFLGDDHIFSVQTTYIYERRSLDASFNLVAPGPLSSNPSNDLRTFRFGGNYYYQRRYGLSAGYFSITGSTDTLAYPASATGSPDTKGWAAELSFMPWQNLKLAAQYTWYQKFNGASTNYDGTGRNASDNNTFYLYAWLAF